MFGAEVILVLFLVLALLIGGALITGVVLLFRRGDRTDKLSAARNRERDRALLLRLEAVDARLERLEKTLNDLPS